MSHSFFRVESLKLNVFCCISGEIIFLIVSEDTKPSSEMILNIKKSLFVIIIVENYPIKAFLIFGSFISKDFDMTVKSQYSTVSNEAIKDHLCKLQICFSVMTFSSGDPAIQNDRISENNSAWSGGNAKTKIYQKLLNRSLSSLLKDCRTNK